MPDTVPGASAATCRRCPGIWCWHPPGNSSTLACLKGCIYLSPGQEVVFLQRPLVSVKDPSSKAGPSWLFWSWELCVPFREERVCGPQRSPELARRGEVLQGQLGWGSSARPVVTVPGDFHHVTATVYITSLSFPVDGYHQPTWWSSNWQLPRLIFKSSSGWSVEKVWEPRGGSREPREGARLGEMEQLVSSRAFFPDPPHLGALPPLPAPYTPHPQQPVWDFLSAYWRPLRTGGSTRPEALTWWPLLPEHWGRAGRHAGHHVSFLLQCLAVVPSVGFVTAVQAGGKGRLSFQALHYFHSNPAF